MVSAAPPVPALWLILIILRSPPQGAQKEHGWLNYVAPTCNLRDALAAILVCSRVCRSANPGTFVGGSDSFSVSAKSIRLL